MKANNGSKADGQSLLEFVLQDYSVGFAVFTMAATLFTELQAIFQCDDAAADEILKYLMPAVITGGQIKEFKKGFFVINDLFHACFLRKGNTLPEGKRCSLQGEKNGHRLCCGRTTEPDYRFWIVAMRGYCRSALWLQRALKQVQA